MSEHVCSYECQGGSAEHFAAELSELRAERDEARAEVERLKAQLASDSRVGYAMKLAEELATLQAELSECKWAFKERCELERKAVAERDALKAENFKLDDSNCGAGLLALLLDPAAPKEPTGIKSVDLKMWSEPGWNLVKETARRLEAERATPAEGAKREKGPDWVCECHHANHFKKESCVWCGKPRATPPELKRGLEQSARGEVRDLGDFWGYARCPVQTPGCDGSRPREGGSDGHCLCAGPPKGKP